MTTIFLENISEALMNLLQWQNILAIVLGVVLGQFMGALPGLTSSMGIALLIPVTFTFPPWVAISMLIGIYKGALFADSTAAILINTPGMPSAAAVMLDGHPLSLQGKGRKALQMALYASVTGDLFSDICLILFASSLAAIALKFGPPEFTMLIIFALTIIAGVATKSFLKGIIAAAAGLLISSIGSDPVLGSSRFIFGKIELIDGLPLIPVLIGVLAMSEIFRQMGRPKDELSKSLAKRSNAREDNRVSFQEYRSCFKDIIKGSAIGTMTGIIPGLGATLASFLSYNEARRSSKHPEKFGKGALEGVAAADAANSAVSGANLIPLLAFGIPGDVVAAILIGAFLVHGITPGPLIFVQETVLIYTIFLNIMFANLVNLITGQLFISIAVYVLNIPKKILFPSVVTIAVIGSYSFKNSFFDVQLMVLFGVLGYLMIKYGYSTISFIIGFILGPIMESWFRRSIGYSDYYLDLLISRPITLMFFVLTIISVYILLKQRRKIIEIEKDIERQTTDTTA